MSFNLGKDFVQNTNQLSNLIWKYETSKTNAKKHSLLEKELFLACALLYSIDLDHLSDSLLSIFTAADRHGAHFGKPWPDLLLCDDEADRFYHSFSKIEKSLLQAAGLNKETRDRICNELEQVRRHTYATIDIIKPHLVIDSIKRLTIEVCDAHKQISTVRNQYLHTLVVKSLACTAIIFNVTGEVLFPDASPTALLASVALGNAAIQIEKTHIKLPEE